MINWFRRNKGKKTDTGQEAAEAESAVSAASSEETAGGVEAEAAEPAEITEAEVESAVSEASSEEIAGGVEAEAAEPAEITESEAESAVSAAPPEEKAASSEEIAGGVEAETAGAAEPADAGADSPAAPSEEAAETAAATVPAAPPEEKAAATEAAEPTEITESEAESAVSAAPPEDAAPFGARKKPGFFSKFFSSLFKDIDDDFYDELEEQLILGDVGAQASEELIENLRNEAVTNKSIKTTRDVKEFLIKDIKRIMAPPENAYDFEDGKSVVMLIGVNGVGKTTFAGKLANLYRESGKKVIVAGADTFRAAAADQLKVWAERAGCYMVSGNEGADPGSVVFDAAQAARARGADVLLCDTAGRLHNKKNLMRELSKLDKIVAQELPDFHKENLIVLDASTGQNALMQAREFKSVMNIDGVVLTKTDGTAKGGIAVAVTREIGVPVKYIGVGEGIGDLRKFDPDAFADALFEE